MRKLRALSLAAVIVTAFAVAATSLAATGTIKLKPTAGRFGDAPDYKALGNGTAAEASWTNKAAASGKFSVLLEKSVPTAEPAYAATLVDGVAGLTVADLGTTGFSVKGTCSGGSPRFNLRYDVDGDGNADGIAFYGCANHIVGTNGDWTRMEVADATVSDLGPVPATATVTQLSVLVDEQGTYWVDDVTAAGQTVGEPNGG